MEKKYLKIFWIENLQNVFIHWFLYEEFLQKNNRWDCYIIELNFKKSKIWKNLEYQNICDINKVYFSNEMDFRNFKSTVYSNLPILSGILEVNDQIFEILDDKDLFEYTNLLLTKFKNHSYHGIKIDIRLWLLSSIYYYFTTKKNGFVNMNWFFSILNVKGIHHEYGKISDHCKSVFIKNNILGADINRYKTLHWFDDVWMIFHVLHLFLNWKDYEKRSFDSKDENYLSLLSKIIMEVNIRPQLKEENYEYYISSILNNLDLDFFEKGYLAYLKGKKIIDENSLLEYALIILVKWNFNLILSNPAPFLIPEQLKEHVRMICYILKWILEWYKNLEKDIKIISHKARVPDLILNKSSKKIAVDIGGIKYWNLFFTNY